MKAQASNEEPDNIIPALDQWSTLMMQIFEEKIWPLGKDEHYAVV